MAGKYLSAALLAAALLFAFFSPTSSSTLSHLGTSVLITGNSTLISPNQTFKIGFFTVDGGSRWYFGIWYASIPIRTYVWVANRISPVSGDLTPATVRLTAEGRLTVTDNSGRDLWRTENTDPAAEAKLLETGNLVLLGGGGDRIVWQSFDFPADTWLPGMAVTRRSPITSWRSPADPSPGPYSLRLSPPVYGEFELIYRNGSTGVTYWSTGRWTGKRFAAVPEMTVPYIYAFRFDRPFTPEASFVYTVADTAAVLLRPFLTRFAVDSAGQLRQYTWSAQTSSWDMFWARPESPCRVYALCGNLGFCCGGDGGLLRPCDCLSGFRPADPAAWAAEDFSGGCRRESDHSCDAADDDTFEEVGVVEFDGVARVSFPSQNRESCEDACLKNCSCVGLNYESETGLCRNLYGNMFNLRNSTVAPVLYIRVSTNSSGKFQVTNGNRKWRTVVVLVGGICALVVIFGSAVSIWAVLRRSRRRRDGRTGEGEEDNEDAVLAAMNLRVFSYKELSAATRGFSEELGHGGFGAVFLGELPDSSAVAVKRLERPGGGDREFRAEVRTIGSIQHVNLVRLRGFCSEDPHRLLVYEYMPRGPLSAYLRSGGGGGRGELLPWAVRFRVAVGTARGIAYLHEECRDCIVHCDIKPENILLDGDYTPKVSDFGLAKLIGRDFSRVITTMRGTWGYVAPEWISGVAITAKADVYSYGMTLLELLGGRRNVEAPLLGEVAEEDGDEKWFFPPWAARRIVEGDVTAVVDPRLAAGEYDRREAERAAMVAVWCIQDHEGARPTMGQVVKMLEGALEVSLPPLPQLLQALVSGDSFRRVGIASDGASTSIGGGDSDERISAVSGECGWAR